MEQNKIVVASAPAKVILFGEHCVVLGTTAIATAISLRTFVQSETHETGKIELTAIMQKGNISHTWNLEDLQFNGEITEGNRDELHNFIKDKTSSITPAYFIPSCQSFLLGYFLFGGKGKSIKCTVKSQVPVGVGLGSSGAYNVSLATSLMKFFSVAPFDQLKEDEAIPEEGLKKIQTYSLLFEKFMHGNPSGIDNATSTYGGIVTIKKGDIKNIAGIRFKILITDTTIQRNTKILVQKVGGLKNLFPDVVDPILESVEAICQRIIKGFIENINVEECDKEENELAVRSQMEILMSLNHHLLGALGVGHKALDEICHISSELQLHSKLTGAGGGGCAITLLREYPSEDVDRIMDKLKAKGFNCFFVDIAEGGVKFHPSFPELNNYQ